MFKHLKLQVGTSPAFTFWHFLVGVLKCRDATENKILILQATVT